MSRFLRSANGLGILATTIIVVWMYTYALGSVSAVPSTVKPGVFTVENFFVIFATVAPLYIAFEAITSAFSLSTNAGSSYGRVGGLINLGTTVVFFGLTILLLSKGSDWGVPAAKMPHVWQFFILSIEDMVVSGSIALLVSLGMRTFGNQPPPA